MKDGDHYYNVSVPDSEDAELYLKGSSQNITRSWEVNSLKVISGGPYIDSWEVKPGPWLFEVHLDPEDKVKETDETNNQAST
ncbi:MAG: CARDB domain-containing protein, partial [Candidatus Nanohaloarchaea archaeon]|nr:CARDB domain-containing protein [Candidatus Nanohaloarchaea archaeon]